MTKELKMLVGVALLAALALAGALGMFTFSPAQPVAAQSTSNDVTREFSASQVARGGTVDVTITLNSGLLVNVTETLPDGWVYDSVSPSGVNVTPSGQMISFQVLTGEDVTYTVTAPDMDGSGMFAGMYAVPPGTPNIVIGGDTTVTVGTDATDGNGDDGDESPIYELSTDVASAGVRIELDAVADNEVPAGEDLTVTLKSWGLPSSIPESSVLILGESGDDTEPYSGEPAEVRIESGNKILLSLTSRYVNGNAAGPLLAGQPYRIVFKKSAGITNPAVAGGRYAIKVDDLDDDHPHLFWHPDQEQDHA